MTLLSIILLFVPLAWELIDDRRGDPKKALDVFIRCLLALAAAVIGWWLTGKPVLDGFILSIAIHFFFFDYIITWILIAGGIIEPKTGTNWFTHQGNTAASDKGKFWKGLKPWYKFYVRAGVLIVAIIIYWI